MREMNIALVLIEQANSYVLQKRGSDPKIGGAGLIGCFGGKLEAGETSIQAGVRELAEETNVRAVISELQFLGKVDVVSDHALEPVSVHADCYQLTLDEYAELQASEGEAVSIPIADIKSWLDHMTTGTRAMFKQLILESN